MKYVWRVLLALLCVLISLCLWQCEMVVYGVRQGVGQCNILSKARPISEVMSDSLFPDSLKRKIEVIQEIRQFAIDSLGLNNSDNYTTIFDQKGKPVLWVVYACPHFSLKEHQWDYPFLGKLGYKGFFKPELAEEEAEELRKKGLQVTIGNVSAWSTLGWFKDPILSNMLYRSEGSLANLIIHELTHATLYIKGDGAFNENLATFVGDQGAYYYLRSKYGEQSKEYTDYDNSLMDLAHYAKHLNKGATRLDSLFNEMKALGLDSLSKQKMKDELVSEIFLDGDTLTLSNKSRFYFLNYPDSIPANTYFTGYLMYREKQSELEKEFKEEYNSDYPKYLKYLLDKYDDFKVN